MAFRGFIAADFASPSPALTAVLHELRTSGAALKLVSPDQLHTTLKFLGDTEEHLVDGIIARIRAACKTHGPFTVNLRGTGAFPRLARMSVVWVGMSGAEPLADIAASLEASLADLGFAPERRSWSPHVTIARVRGGPNLDRVRQIVEAHAGDAFGEERIERIWLKRSTLTPTGPVYSPVDAVAL